MTGRTGIWRLSLLAIVAMAMMSLPACDRSPETPRNEPIIPIERSWSSGDIQVTLTLDRTELTVAESILLTIRVDAPNAVTVELSPVEEAAPDDWSVQRETSGPSEGGDRSTPRFVRYHLEPFLPGDFEIDAIQVVVHETGESDGTVFETEPIAVTVRSVMPAGADATEPAAAKGIVEPQRLDWTPWLWALLLLGAVLSGFAAWRLLDAGRDRRREPKPEPAAHLAALRELDQLLGEGMIERGEFKRYYERLTDIVRRYIERGFGLRAPERTTEEFLQESREAGLFSGPELDQFEQFLLAADLVKFARHEPTRSQADDAAKTARRFIEQSAPRTEDAGRATA